MCYKKEKKMSKYLILKLSKFFKRKSSTNRNEINLAQRVSLDVEDESFTSLFKQIFEESKDEHYSYKINLTNSKFIYPSALIFLLALQESLKNQNVGLELQFQEGSPIHEYLVYCGISNYFDILDLPKNLPKTISANESNIYQIESGEQLIDTYCKSTKLVDMFKEQQDISFGVESELIDSIDEVLRNIKQHSGFTKYYLLAQLYPASHRIRYVFYDNGMGIKSHLTRNGYDSLPNFVKEKLKKQDYDKIAKEPANLAIKEASKYLITGTDNKEQNSGAGIDFLLNNLLPATRGTVTILSEDGLVQWENGGKNITKDFYLGYKIRGTLVSIVVNYRPNTQLINTMPKQDNKKERLDG